MKRFATLACALALAAPVFAAQNDPLVFFSTQGPDTYGDGATVLDGEYYALVWVKSGADFAGFQADGALVDPDNSVCLLKAGLAQNGRCPTVAFQLPAEFVDTHKDGTYGVWLLDTRIADGDGGTVVGGIAKSVNGYGKVASATPGATVSADAVSVTSLSALPAGTPKPVIKAMEVKDGYVFITVEGTVPYLQYNVAADSTPALDAAEEADVPQTGDADQDILLIAPADGDSGFFRVEGSRQ